MSSSSIQRRGPPLSALARVIAASLGRGVALPLAALFVGVALPSAIVFGGNGVAPRDLLRWLDEDTSLRAALWVAWIALATPVLARAIDARGTRILRTLPIARRVITASVLVVALTVQTPWALLFAIGGGAWAAAAAASLSVTIQGSLLAGVTRPIGAAALGIAIVLVALGAPFAVEASIGAALAWVAIASAWRLAPERDATAIRMTGRGPAALTFLTAYAVQLARVERGRAARALGVVVVGALAARIVLRNNPASSYEGVAQRLFAVGVLPAVLAAASLADPIARTGERLVWIARAVGRRPRFARATSIFTTWLLTTLAGAGFALAANGAHARATAELALWFGALGAGTHAITRHEEARGDGGRRALLQVVLVAIAWLLTGEGELAAMAGATAMVVASTIAIARAR